MQQQEKIRQRLISIYERSTPLQQALLQLISVIYEKATIKTIYNCLRNTGLTFPAEPVASAEHLLPHLNELQQLRLLDKHFRCHDAIVEVISRRLVGLGAATSRQELLAAIAAPSSWVDMRTSGRVCLACGKDAPGLFLKTSSGSLCESCVLAELKAVAMQEDLASWPPDQIKEALSPGADLVQRLTVLWRFQEVLQLGTDMNSAVADELLVLLVRQLGFAEPVALARSVRQVALEVALDLDHRILPQLIGMCQKEPWQLYANIVLAAGTIAPNNSAVRTMLEEAAKDSNPEVRKRVVSAITASPSYSGWTKGMLKVLAHDRDASVREHLRAFTSPWRGVHESYRRAPTLPDGASASSRYQIMVRAVRAALPARLDSLHFPGYYCQRIMRELRIGIYLGDENHANRCRDLLLTSCVSTSFTQSDPFARVVMNPFDADWFRTLPVKLQCSVLNQLFAQTMVKLEPDEELLAYAVDPNFLNSLPRPETPKLLPQLIGRLLMGGRLKQVQDLIENLGSPANSKFGLTGWLLFVEGKNDEAVKSFDQGLKQWLKTAGRRSGYFSRMSALFHVLALIRKGDGPSWKKIEQILPALGQPKEDFLDSAFSSLRAILHAQNGELEAACEQIAKNDSLSGLCIFFSAFARYWLDGHLGQEKIDELSHVFVRSREIGLDWLAMESAELLCRTEQRTPIRDNYIHKVQEETGMRSFVSSIQVEEGWRKGLRALEKIARPQAASTEIARDVRLVWLLGFHGSNVTIQAKEQKISAKGGWTKGRTISINRLLEGVTLDFASEQDRAVMAAIERSSPYSYDFVFNRDKALLALVGHPLIFLEENPMLPIELVKSEPEIIVTQSDSNLNIRLSPAIAKQRLLLLREAPTRFKLIEFLDTHRRIAGLLGEDGLTVPASAGQEVAATIATLSSLITVHSAIGGDSAEIVQIEADPTPHMHLMPAGPGLRVELFVKPFAEGGPYLKPGVGANNLIADVGGKRMQAKRDLTAEKAKADEVEAASSILAGFAEGERRWLFHEPEPCLQLLLDLKALQESGGVILEWPEGEKLQVVREASFDQLQMQIRGKTDWFEVSGQLQVDDELVLDMRQLLDLLQSAESRFVPLGEGQFLALTNELRKRLLELNVYVDRRGKSVGLHPLAVLAIQDLTENLPHLKTDAAWKRRLDRIKSSQAITPVVPSTFKGQLRDYQMQGYRWLARLAHMGVGACLADDMGLGKTIQALAAILDRAPKGPSLIIAPTSVCMNWLTEADRFAPTLNIHQFGGNGRRSLIGNLKAHDVLVTSYGLLYLEAELLASVEWTTIVLDEAQAIKNFTSKRSQAAMRLKGDFKIITTGTPIENHLSELWTLFNFINPGLLGSQKKFNERFAVPIERYSQREPQKRLKKLIQPFILRRNKAQVLEELPPRTDVLLRVQMSDEEAAFYEALRRQAVERIEADNLPIHQKHLKILAEIKRLRQAACNTRLVVPESRISSTKLDLFGEIISDLLENKHKALVFSQFVGHLALIREYLEREKIDYRYLDGSTAPAERKKQVDAFQAGKGDLFLISLKAGGLGLNLTAADYVIHMDTWWNPAVEDQAADRTHRIGQQRPVTVYRLVTEGSIEEKIVKLHQEKRDLAGSLLDGSDLSGKISAEELLRLIQEQ